MRPIKQISGYSNFNEIFFIDPRLPDARRLGDAVNLAAGLKGKAEAVHIQTIPGCKDMLREGRTAASR